MKKMGGRGEIDLVIGWEIWDGSSWAHPYGKTHGPPLRSHLVLRPPPAHPRVFHFSFFLLRLLQLLHLPAPVKCIKYLFFIIIKLLNM